MIIELDEKNKAVEANMGDLIITENGYRFIVKDTKGYALMDKDGLIRTSWYENKKDLLEQFEIRDIINNKKIKLTKTY